MSSLKAIERIKLEKFLEMSGGYVCDFSDRTFGDFILETTGIDVYTDEYSVGGTSKANRLRTFWKKESNSTTAKLLQDILDYWRTQKLSSFVGIEQAEQILYEECKKITDRLQKESPIENIDVLKPNSDDKSFVMLVNSIRESIKRDNPAEALDRLHTFVVKYFRELCKQQGLSYDKNTPVNSLMGAYIKKLKENNLIDSEMTATILKSSITVLEKFNSVRNDFSLAHDNSILNYDESVLIFNNIIQTIKFIESVGKKIKIKPTIVEDNEEDEEIDLNDITFEGRKSNDTDLTLEEAWDMGLI
jgi:hypothetical protein